MAMMMRQKAIKRVDPVFGRPAGLLCVCVCVQIICAHRGETSSELRLNGRTINMRHHNIKVPAEVLYTDLLVPTMAKRGTREFIPKSFESSRCDRPTVNNNCRPFMVSFGWPRENPT